MFVGGEIVVNVGAMRWIGLISGGRYIDIMLSHSLVLDSALKVFAPGQR